MCGSFVKYKSPIPAPPPQVDYKTGEIKDTLTHGPAPTTLSATEKLKRKKEERKKKHENRFKGYQI